MGVNDLRTNIPLDRDVRQTLARLAKLVGRRHGVLDTEHSDAIAGTVTRGALIVGNATPKWSLLTLGATARVLRSDGTDASWAQVALATDVSGTLKHENGGLEADVSAYEGLIKIASGATSNIKCNFAASAAPAVTDDGPDGGYSVGSIWLDTTNDEAYICLDATNNAAVWKQLTATGGGSGATLAEFGPYDNVPPTSNYATLDLRNNIPVLDFDASTNESAVFGGTLPNGYQGGGVSVYIWYMMTSATSGDIDWDGQFESQSDGDTLTSDSFATAQSTDNTTVPGTAGIVDVVQIDFSDGAQMDSLAAGERFRLKITRDAASDTATGDAELVAVEIREQ